MARLEVALHPAGALRRQAEIVERVPATVGVTFDLDDGMAHRPIGQHPRQLIGHASVVDAPIFILISSVHNRLRSMGRHFSPPFSTERFLVSSSDT
jgi:hypothetical protein